MIADDTTTNGPFSSSVTWYGAIRAQVRGEQRLCQIVDFQKSSSLGHQPSVCIGKILDIGCSDRFSINCQVVSEDGLNRLHVYTYHFPLSVLLTGPRSRSLVDKNNLQETKSEEVLQ